MKFGDSVVRLNDSMGEVMIGEKNPFTKFYNDSHEKKMVESRVKEREGSRGWVNKIKDDSSRSVIESNEEIKERYQE